MKLQHPTRDAAGLLGASASLDLNDGLLNIDPPDHHLTQMRQQVMQRLAHAHAKFPGRPAVIRPQIDRSTSTHPHSSKRVLRSWGPGRTADLARWRQRVGVLAYDEAMADKWGQPQARAQLRGRPRPHNDTWIAACCLVDDLPLATLNTKDFSDFAEYEGLTII